MFRHFSMDSEEGKNRKSQAPLIALLFLLAVGAYTYFFTELLNLREIPSAPQTYRTARIKKAILSREPDQEREQADAKSEEAPESPRLEDEAKPISVKASLKYNLMNIEKESPAKAALKPSPSINKAVEKKRDDFFTLKITDLVALKNVNSTTAKLKKAGITPVSRYKGTTVIPMHRLFYAEYPDYKSAAADLDILRAKKATGAFIVREGEKCILYAGSYIKEKYCAIEQDRLFDEGVRLVMKTAPVEIPMNYITAGSFASQEEADNAVEKLKKARLAVDVIQNKALVEK